MIAAAFSLLGLSPRVRGNRGVAQRAGDALRSIPACAGEPVMVKCDFRGVQVYPRVCGGTYAQYQHSAGFDGLSPRVRGNLISFLRAVVVVRSIPACAGEPTWCVIGATELAVYPRVCGGTAPGGRGIDEGLGLSPRVRGNRVRRTRRLSKRRSIPACAGEPQRPGPSATVKRVYPRVCGGTVAQVPPAGRSEGLSPRVRGNRVTFVAHRKGLRSIPACAGEPKAVPASMTISRVYPRVCGGTPRGHKDSCACPGLSPRVRGNPLTFCQAHGSHRSIPACAGEPYNYNRGRAAGQVYPRVCGGTVHPRLHRLPTDGLSPRVRGNPKALGLELVIPGSIPACAGEPRPAPPAVSSCWVYPRVCGGTRWSFIAARRSLGLSPRVRGNQVAERPAYQQSGSIPACAGEPCTPPPANW